jgi:uncharacterized membrane protein
MKNEQQTEQQTSAAVVPAVAVASATTVAAAAAVENSTAENTKAKRVRKPRERKGKKVKTAKFGEIAEESGPAQSVEEVDFLPYDPDAWKWMAEQSIPGAYSPILYIGTEVSARIAQILGRPMNIIEAQYLVQPDGPVTDCSAINARFQPIRYLPFEPRWLEKELRAGKSLTELDLPWGGAYYIKKDGTVLAFSGSVFHYDSRSECYRWCKSSPLVIAADATKDRFNQRPVWGSPLEEIQNILDARRETRERENKIGALVADIVPISRRMSRMGEAFDRAEQNRRPAPYRRDRRPISVESDEGGGSEK